MKYLGVVAITLTAFAINSGNALATAGKYSPQQELRYDAVWNASWARIAKDSKPLVASSKSPGVCNIGGSQKGCLDTDEELITDYRSLANRLSGSIVPSEFAQANRTLHQFVMVDIRGLSERDAIIESQNTNATFKESNQELERAAKLIEKAVSEYNGPDKPSNPFS
jgi:hypothetical protein